MAAKSALDILKRILLSFRRNWGLKLISLLFAVILWNYVIVQVNPIRSMTYTGVQIDVRNQTLLNNSGFSVSGDINKSLKAVTVSVDLPRSDAFQLNNSNIHVYADLSNITREGTVDVWLTCTPPKGTLKSITPQKITLKIEKRNKRVVPVQCNLTGNLPEDYWRDEPVLDSKTLEINGADTSVKKVAKAVVTVDLTNLTQELSVAKDYTLLDSDGNVLDPAGLDFKPNCIVTIQVLKKKIVKLDVSNSLSGSVANGYKIDDVIVDPDTVEIYGPASVLDTIDTLRPGPIDIDGAKTNLSFSLPLKLPKDVHPVSDDTIQVSVKVSMKMTSVTLTDLHIKIADLGPGLKVDQAFTASVTLSCPELYAQKIRRAFVNLFADAAGLAAGTHTLPVTATYDDPAIDATVTNLNPSELPVKIVATTP